MLGTMALLVFRIRVEAGYNSCLAALGVEEEEEKGDHVPPKVIYDSFDYLSVYLQESNEHLRDVGDTFRRCITAFYLVQFMRLAHFFPNEDYVKYDSFFSSSNQDVVGICSVIVHHIQACSCNAYEINEMVESTKLGGRESREMGGAVYANVSLSNHSCFPNTMR